jgi:hypothetical protein
VPLVVDALYTGSVLSENVQSRRVAGVAPQALRSLLTKLGFQQESASLLYARR